MPALSRLAYLIGLFLFVYVCRVSAPFVYGKRCLPGDVVISPISPFLGSCRVCMKIPEGSIFGNLVDKSNVQQNPLSPRKYLFEIDFEFLNQVLQKSKVET